MSATDRAGVTGELTLVLRGPDGRVKETRSTNTVTEAGRNGIADQMLESPTLRKPTHMGVGMPLQSELARNPLTSKTRAGATVTMVADWKAGDATGALSEAGIFDAASAGNMWASASFAAADKAPGDSMSISWALTVS